MSWSDNLQFYSSERGDTLFFNVTRLFDHRFVFRNYDDDGLYSYELDYLKKTFLRFYESTLSRGDLQDKDTIVIAIETERAPKYKSCIPFLDFIQELFPDKKIICSHHDWQEVDAKYKKIPSLSYLDGAISGCGIQITEDPMDYDREDHIIK